MFAQETGPLELIDFILTVGVLFAVSYTITSILWERFVD